MSGNAPNYKLKGKIMGIKDPFVRWWITFSVMLIALTTALVGGLGNFILMSDVTFLSWGILLVFLLGSLLLGKTTHKYHKEVFKNSDINEPDVYIKRYSKNEHFGLVNYCVETLTSLGLLGTIVGLIIMVVGAFFGLDITNQESITTALVAMSSGIGTALVTTLVGLTTAILLKFQLAVVRGNDVQ